MFSDIYKVLINDQSASRTIDEKEIDMRIKEALKSEDPDIIVDLRELIVAKQTIIKSSGNTVNRIYETVLQFMSVNMAKTISVRDLIAQVKECCPEGTPIPSESWVHFNFCPQNPRERVSKLYHGRLGAKRVVQKRLMRKYQPDSHYASALF